MDAKKDYGYQRFDMKMRPDERQALELLAKNTGTTMSGWIKRAINRATEQQATAPQ